MVDTMSHSNQSFFHHAMQGAYDGSNGHGYAPSYFPVGMYGTSIGLNNPSPQSRMTNVLRNLQASTQTRNMGHRHQGLRATPTMAFLQCPTMNVGRMLYFSM